jgi:predicted permease
MVPGWIVRALSRVVPVDRQDDVVGDLQELHGRRVRRWGPVVAGLISVPEGLVLIVSHLVRAVARAAFGGDWGVSRIELRLALRLLLQQPILTLTSVVALGVGIGMAAGGFSVLRQAMYSVLPFENGDRWVVIETYAEETGGRAPLDLERLRLFRESAPAFAYIAGAESAELNIVHGDGEVERVAGARVTPGTFAYLPYVPMVGRLLTADDGRPGAPAVALIRESLWERRYARAPGVVGRSIDIGGTVHAVIGVLPDEAGYPSQGEIWLALDEESLGAATDRAAVRGSRQIAVLSEGATVEQAESQLASLSEAVSGPGTGVEARRHRITPLTRTLASPQAQVAGMAMVTVLLAVLLVIAANVANLIVARTSRRSAELAVRTALGAPRSRLVGQLFVEVLAIGAIATVPGLAVAAGILRLYDGLLDELPFWVDLRLDPATAVVVVALALLASGLIGVVPALRATRRRSSHDLRGAGRGGTLGVGRIGGAMIVVEVALSVALLGAAALFAEGFRAYANPEFDLPDDRVLTARLAIDLSRDEIPEGGGATVRDSVMTTVRALRAALSELPGVTGVAVASHLPRLSPLPEPMVVEGRDEVVPTPLVRQGPGAFAVLEVEPLLGRAIEERDLEAGAPPVAVVNQAFAVENFGSTQVVGRRLRLAPESGAEEPGPWREIVGVVPNVMEVTGSGSAAGVYFPFEPVRFFSVALGVEGDPMALAGQLRRAAFDVDPDLQVTEVVRLDDVGDENRTALRVMSSAMTAIGVVTLLLSLAGVYSIVSLAVTRRTREIGVRVALGAPSSSILWSIVRRSALLVGGGGLLGAVAGFQVSSTRIFVFAVPAAGAWLFAALVALMALAGVLACWVPARRALAIQPVEALRYD